MKRLRKLPILFCCLLFVLLFPYKILAHSGNTDSYGGHYKTENGTYHCHSNPCLEDARETAYEIYFPIGQEDGLIGYDDTSGILEYLTDELDADQFEYILGYAMEAYKAGYEDTYIPTFWEKYKFYIGWGILLFGVFAINRLKKLKVKEKNYDVLKQDEKMVTSKRNDTIVLKKSSIIWSFLVVGVMIFILVVYLDKPINDSSNISNMVAEDDNSQIEKTLPTTGSQPEISQIIVNSPTNELTRLYPEFLFRLNELNSELESAATVWETGSDFEILEYSQREYKEWDTLLNSIYNTLKAYLVDEQFINLRDSQRTWIIERERIAKEASQYFEGGSLESPVYISTQANETKLRCYWLIQNYMQ